MLYVATMKKVLINMIELTLKQCQK